MKPSQPIPILLYHSISREASHKFLPYIVRPDDFAEQMAQLEQFCYTPMTISDIVARTLSGGSLPEKPVAITFDDGFADFYDEALPILSRYHYPATLYVVTGCIGLRSKWLTAEGEGNRAMMTWDLLRQAHDAGIEIGAHSHTHRQLDILPDAEVMEEVRTPKRLLEAELGTAVNSFAYPYGYHSASTIKQVQDAGYTSAAAVKHAVSFNGDNIFALGRMFVYVSTHIGDFRKMLRGETVPMAPQNEALRTKIWRIYRSLRNNAN